MIKHGLSILLAVVILLTMPTGVTYAAKDGNYQYDILSDGTAEITHYYQSSYSVDHLVIPQTIEGYTVTSIGVQAFSACTATSIVIPDTVTRIKRSAFFTRTKLESVSLPENLKAIEQYAFYGNTNLKRIVFPDALEEIGEQAFFGCDMLDSMIVLNSLKNVAWQVFEGCDSLRNVYYKGTEEEWVALQLFRSNIGNVEMQSTVHYEFDLKTGDTNGDKTINMMDALRLYAATSGKISSEPLSMMLSDINKDAQVNMLDALELYTLASGA